MRKIKDMIWEKKLEMPTNIQRCRADLKLVENGDQGSTHVGRGSEVSKNGKLVEQSASVGKTFWYRKLVNSRTQTGIAGQCNGGVKDHSTSL